MTIRIRLLNSASSIGAPSMAAPSAEHLGLVSTPDLYPNNQGCSGGIGRYHILIVVVFEYRAFIFTMFRERVFGTNSGGRILRACVK